MLARPALPLLVFVATCSLAACQRSPQPLSADATATQPTAPLATQVVGDEWVAGLLNLSVDPITLTATVTPHAPERAAQFQALNFDLDIAAFLKRDSFRIRGLTTDSDGDLVVTFTHTHPFAAPNLLQPPTAQNRADLGYTGRVLFVREVPGSQLANAIFFDDGTSSIVTDTQFIKNADGYLHPGDLLRSPVLLANTFPYMLLADESKDNRLDVSNNGDPQGSYNDAPGGWQRPALAVNNIGWTGFDFVHAGQIIQNSFTINREALASGTFDLQVALVIKYSQPAGAPPRTNRQLHFPLSPADVTQFAYRLPYAALDASQSTVNGPVLITPLIGANATVEVQLRDWDSRGIEASSSSLATETDVTLIQQGASGQPVATVSAPRLSAGLFPLLPVDPFVSGEPGDEILYSGVLTNILGTAPIGTVPGLIRFVDPEDTDPAAASYRYGSDPNTLAADPNRALRVRTFQYIPITVANPAPVITAVSPGGTVGATGQQVSFSATVTGTVDSWSWSFDTGAVPGTSTDASPLVTLEAPGIYSGTVVATNTFGSSAPFNFDFTVSAPTSPTWNKHLILDTGNVGRFSAITAYGSGFAVSHGELGAGGLPRVSISTTANPTGPSDWTHVVVDPLAGTSAIYSDLLVHAGRLFVAYYTGNPNQDINLARANVAAPGVPSGFTNYAVDTPGNPGINLNMVESSTGRLLMASGRTTPTPSGLRFNYATVADPLLPSDWLSYDAVELADVGAASGSNTMGSRLILHNGNPAFVFGAATGATIRGPWVAQATVPVPTSKAQWTIHNVENTGTSVLYSSVASTGGRLGVVYYDGSPNTRLRFAHAAVTTPVSSADWSTPITLDGGPGVNIGQHVIMQTVGGRFAAVYYDNSPVSPNNGNFKVARALSQTPDLLTEWVINTIETGGTSSDPGKFGRALMDNSGIITLTYQDDLLDDLYFARASTTW